ncbi:hypothetical protein MBLNU457_g2385t1 [Dothideomycetes sp. NU457]
MKFIVFLPTALVATLVRAYPASTTAASSDLSQDTSVDIAPNSYDFLLDPLEDILPASSQDSSITTLSDFSLDPSLDTSAQDFPGTDGDLKDLLAFNDNDDDAADEKWFRTHKYPNIILRKDAVARHNCTEPRGDGKRQTCHMTYFQGDIKLNWDAVTGHRCYDVTKEGSMQRCRVRYSQGYGDPVVEASPSPLAIKLDKFFASPRKELKDMIKMHRVQEKQLRKQHRAVYEAEHDAARKSELRKQFRAEQRALHKKNREEEQALRDRLYYWKGLVKAEEVAGSQPFSVVPPPVSYGSDELRPFDGKDE